MIDKFDRLALFNNTAIKNGWPLSNLETFLVDELNWLHDGLTDEEFNGWMDVQIEDYDFLNLN